MRAVRDRDLHAVLTFIGEAEAANGPETLAPSALARLRELVPSTAVSWHEWSVEDGVVRVAVSSADPDRTAAVWEDYPRHRYEDPLPGGCEGVGPCTPRVVGRTLTLSEVVGRRAFRRTGLYATICRPLGVEHVMKHFLPVEQGMARSIVLDRNGRDFGERDRAVVDLLVPHLRNLERAARAFRLAAALAAGADETGELIVVNAARRIEFATGRARRLLARYAVAAEDVVAAPEVAAWLRVPRRDRIALERGSHALELRRLDGHEGAVLVAEQAAPSGAAGLTSRELQVMALVAEGRSNAEVAAALWLAPGTVRKHLENVYAKLGVRSRTSAVARLRQLDSDENG